jgi:hypothetical protein
MLVPKTYPLLIACIENGCARGIARAYKHTEAPSRDDIQLQVEEAVLLEILEAFELSEEEV